MLRFLAVLAAVGLAGCTFDEQLDIYDLHGKVVVPRSAATRTFKHSDGSEEEITDVRLLGPVILGLYSNVEEGLFDYPHPSMGPLIGDLGDTYPYGGTTVGDFRYPCSESLVCKHVSGRYQNFDEIIDWFRDTVEDPVKDNTGIEITTGDYLRQICYDQLEVTSDAEVRMTGDLDFTENADGDFEATFTIWQQDFIPDFSLWGWIDSPSETYTFSTCNPTDGQSIPEYNTSFFGGTQFQDVLDFPSEFIAAGDYVAGFGDDADYPNKWHDPSDELVIRIDVPVEN